MIGDEKTRLTVDGGPGSLFLEIPLAGVVERWCEAGARPDRHGFVENYRVFQEHSCLLFHRGSSSPSGTSSMP